MRHEICCVAALSALLLSVSGSLVASPAAKPTVAPAAYDPDLISNALCGRANEQRDRAEALGGLGSTIQPLWRKSKIADVELWLNATMCHDATPAEAARFEDRREALERLRFRIERAHVTELIQAALAHFRGWRLGADDWPSSSECPACGELRRAAAQVLEITASWPEWKQADNPRIGPRLAAAAKLEPLITKLCMGKPSPGTRGEIERRFRYYFWTAEGARLFEIVAFFEQPEVVAGCQDR